MKRFFSIIILAALCLSLRVAASNEFLANGGFEQAENGVPTGWTVPVGTIGESVRLTDAAYEGSVALRLSGDGKPAYIMQEIDGLRAGSVHTLTLSVKVAGGGTFATVRVEYLYKKDGKTQYLSDSTVEKPLRDTAGKWKKETVSFTPPKQAETTRIMLRLTAAGEWCADAVSLTGGEAAGTLADEEGVWTPESIEAGKNLLENVSFEEVENGKPVDWRFFNNQDVSLNTDKEYAHSGNNSIKISTESTRMPWARFVIKDKEAIIPGATYTFTAYVRTTDTTPIIASYKTEFYEFDMYDNMTSGLGSGGGDSPKITVADGWAKIEKTEVIPEFTNQIWAYLRIYSSATVYYDDVSYCMTQGPPPLTDYKTDSIFYYSGEKSYGTATATSNVQVYSEQIGASLRFALRDGIMTLHEQIVAMGENGKAVYHYPLALMTEKQKEYNVNCELLDADGNTLVRKNQTVYIFDRPNYIGKDGIYRENGEEFHPVYWYHAGLENLETLKTLGANLIQGYPVDSWMEQCNQLQFKQIVVLYVGGGNGQSAGHPNRLAGTIASVTKYKDDPSVFGWALMDEPGASSFGDLLTAYKAIRAIDPNHPTFITANGHYEDVQKYCDVLSCDQYPYGLFPFTTADFKNITTSVEIVDNQMPVYNLLQAFDYRDSFPTANEIRNMTYQSLWAGAKGLGFYSFGDTQVVDGVNKKVTETRLYEPIESFFRLEWKDACEHFIRHAYPTFTEVRGEKVWYRAWVKENDLQLLVLNRDHQNAATAEIDLTSADKSVSAGDFRATVVNGSESSPVNGSDGKFSVTLEPGQAVLYDISTQVDLSGITDCIFSDMYEHGWAIKAVDALQKAGILETNNYVFRPAENITRGDFAAMLVRAMGLTASDEEQFADVDKINYYAKELAIGKAAGILNGIGNNCFNPDGEITRQDLMTMVSRALKLTGTADLSAFADSTQIAAYAKEHVAAMVSAGLVQGNTDGTLNPAGSTTRAEAAVIVDRMR